MKNSSFGIPEILYDTNCHIITIIINIISSSSSSSMLLYLHF
jgi:hypothetical protein